MVDHESTIREKLAPRIQKLKAIPPNGEGVDFLISQYEEHTEQGRHSESERSLATTFVLATQSAVFVYLGSKEFACRFWPIALLIPALSLYGFYMCIILYARFRRHSLFAFAFRSFLEEGLPEAGVGDARDAVNATYKKRHNLHRHWLILHGGIGSLSLILILALMMHSCPPEDNGGSGKKLNPASQPASVNLSIENSNSVSVQSPAQIAPKASNTHPGARKMPDCDCKSTHTAIAPDSSKTAKP